METTAVQKIIYFATTNKGKIISIKKHIKNLGVEVKPLKLEPKEIQSNLFKNIALSKAKYAFQQIKQPVIAEDGGFILDNFNGFPGPYTKHVIESIGARGIVRLLAGDKNRGCHFESALAYVDNKVHKVFTDVGSKGLVSDFVDNTPCKEAWSDLWKIFIPNGQVKTLTALSKKERQVVWDEWKENSTFVQFANWYNNYLISNGEY